MDDHIIKMMSTSYSSDADTLFSEADVDMYTQSSLFADEIRISRLDNESHEQGAAMSCPTVNHVTGSENDIATVNDVIRGENDIATVNDVIRGENDESHIEQKVEEEQLASLNCTMSCPTVSDLIGDEDSTLMKFPLRRYSENESRPEFEFSAPILNIPIHQRIYRWKPGQREKFIDTVMLNGYRASIIITESISKDGKKHWDLEDGQHRLRTLQQYMLDEFPWNGKRFSELSKQQKRKIWNYQLPVQVYTQPSLPLKIRMFTRINTTHRKLGDNELYWSIRNTSPLVKFVFDKLAHLDGFEEHVSEIYKENVRTVEIDNTKVKDKITGEVAAEGCLRDIIGVIISLIYSDGDVGLTISYEKNAPYVEKGLNEDQEKKILLFFTQYIEIIREVKEKLAAFPKKVKIGATAFSKINPYLSIYLFMFLNQQSNIPEEDSLSEEVFIAFICDHLRSKTKKNEFMNSVCGKEVCQEYRVDTSKMTQSVHAKLKLDAIRTYYENQPPMEKRRRK